MREILFRGKRTDSGEWYFGYYHVTHGTPAIFKKTEIDPREDYAFVDPSTVGEYTGLTDRNGRKIFEGDIVKYGDTIHRVAFEQRSGTAYFGLVYSPIETLPFGHYQDLKQIEIIGNIYDTPELLESEG